MSSATTQTASPSRQPARPALGQLLNIPNMLSLARLLLVPVFLASLSRHRPGYAPLYIFGVAALTDALDGTVARWFDCKTELGAFLDPFADKLLLLSAFVALTIQHTLPVYLLGVVVTRDVVIVFGYFMLSFFTGERVPVRPTYLGKVSTFLQLACVIGGLSQFCRAYPNLWLGLLYTTVSVTAASGVHYAYRGLVLLSSHEPEMFE